MNEEEFRKEVFDRFRRNGIEEEIKLKVTEKLIDKFKPVLPQLVKGKPASNPKDLRNQLMISLISEFLEKKKLDTSREVLTAEYGNPSLLLNSELIQYFSHIPTINVNAKLEGGSQPIFEDLCGIAASEHFGENHRPRHLPENSRSAEQMHPDRRGRGLFIASQIAEDG